MPLPPFAVPALALALLAGCASTPRAARGPTPPATFEPAPCSFEGVDEGWAKENGIDCGWVFVPESHGKDRTRTLKLWVAIARATEPSAAQPPLLYLQGGPGIAAVDAVVPYLPKSATWSALRKRRDVLFLDQRGTGRSEPVFCPALSREFHALELESPPAEVARERRLAALKTCRTELLEAGMDFSAYNSAATTDDAEVLRRALGISQWNVYGVSYGTWIALEYLRRHPASVRATILDSPYPPNSGYWAESSVVPTGRALEEVDRACRLDPACAQAFPDVGGALREALARLDKAPLPREGGRIDATAFNRALWVLLVGTRTVRYVPLAIQHAAKGDDAVTRRFVEAFGGTGSFGAYSHGQALAVNCYESWAGQTALALGAARKRYPFLVPADALDTDQDQLCALWQPDRAPPETFAPVKSATPVLLLAGEFDPASPPEDTLQAARLLSSATVVNVPGASHAPMGTDDCTRGIAARFLDTPSQRPDTSCLAARPEFQFATHGFEAFLEGP